MSDPIDLAQVLDGLEFPPGNRNMCPLCDGWNMSPCRATPYVHTKVCTFGALRGAIAELTRLRAADESRKRRDAAVDELVAALRDMIQWISAMAYGQSAATYEVVKNSPRMDKARTALAAIKGEAK